MAHEFFEDEEVILLLNESYVSIKVDREERPDGAEGKMLATLSPFVGPMHSVDHKPTVYLCEQYSCKKPITKVSELKTVLH